MRNLLSGLLLILVLVGGSAWAVPGLDDPLDSPVVVLVPLLPQEPTGAVDLLQGETVYPRSACIGAVVNGECHGSVLPSPSPSVRCYGQMLNGQCTGPQF
jgi:hypothetical protein